MRVPYFPNALCAQHPNPELWATEHWDDQKKQDEAKSICRKCDHQDDCLLFSLINKEETGIWGAMNSDERRAFLRSKHGQIWIRMRKPTFMKEVINNTGLSIIPQE
jgi:hypothetical protein